MLSILKICLVLFLCNMEIWLDRLIELNVSHLISIAQATIRKLEHENADLRFLNSQYVHKVRALEKDCKARNDRISDLQEKNFHAVVQTPGDFL